MSDTFFSGWYHWLITGKQKSPAKGYQLIGVDYGENFMNETQIKVLSGKITAVEIQKRYEIVSDEWVKKEVEAIMSGIPVDFIPDDLLKRVNKLLGIDTTQQT